MPFRFRLARILKLREREEERRKQEFALHRRAELECQLARQEAEQEKRNVMVRLARREPGPVAVSSVLNASRHLLGLEARLARLAVEAVGLEKARQAAEVVY